MIIADTSGLLAYFRRREPRNEEVSAVVDGSSDTFVISPFVLAELDYLIADRDGVNDELATLAALASGAYELPPFEVQDIAAAVGVIEKYRDQQIGLTDASIVVLAERYKTKQILTLDHRHFSALRPLSGGRFKLLP